MSRRSTKIKRKIAAVVLVCCLAGVLLLGFFLWQELSERKSGLDYYRNLAAEYAPGQGESGEQQEKSERRENSETEFTWLTELQKACPDVAGWITLEDSQIDYPVVQGEDNDFYLHHVPDGTANEAGSIMMDSQCSPDWSDEVIILYGHHMKNGSMFGSLEAYGDPAYWESHKTIQLYTPSGMQNVEIFAACEVDGNQFSYQTAFTTAEEKENWFRELCSASSFQADSSIGSRDQILLLSTCAYSFQEARYVVAGRVIY